MSIRQMSIIPFVFALRNNVKELAIHSGLESREKKELTAQASRGD